MPPIITVFCPFTRPEYVRRWFDDLASTDLKPENTNLAFIIDTGENKDTGEADGQKIYSRIMDEMNRTNFRKFLIVRNSEHHPNPMNIPIRRRRIAEVRNQAKDLISILDGEFVLGLEDDTVFTNLCVERLYRPFQEQENVGLVSAYEAGRWHNKIIGIWNFDNPKDPREAWTELPGTDYEEVGATGWYCYLTPKELFLSHESTTEDWQPWGPDVNYGLWLQSRDHKVIVDWSQPCGHQDGEGIITPNNNLYVESFWREDTPVWNRKRQEL